jgi:hypothetical protein
MDHQHSADGDADNCFGCKMAYRRERGGISVHAPSLGNGESWFDNTIKYAQDRQIAECAANGWEARVKHPIYDAR